MEIRLVTCQVVAYERLKTIKNNYMSSPQKSGCGHLREVVIILREVPTLGF